MPLAHCQFKSAWWLHNPHLQTLYPALLRKKHGLNRQRERLLTPDGDFLDLDWHGDDKRIIVILLHGLSGSSQSGYILGLQHSLKQQGLSSVALNFRGCSGEPNRLARCYHSGETEDIHFVYQTLQQRYPQAAFAAVGFSIGGNVLLKWLGEQGNKLNLFAAVAICVPLILADCATKLDHGFSRVYRHQLLKELKDHIEHKKHHLESIGRTDEANKLRQLGDLSTIRSFWQYDDRVVAPLHGFRDVHDYYGRSSSRQFLPAIQIPTLLIQAEDDPFMPKTVLPEASELPPQVMMEIYTGGGHVGFVSGHRFCGIDYWLDTRIPAFLHERIKNPFA